jgi:protocatechuate 3,4-dioxygenase beta subunit
MQTHGWRHDMDALMQQTLSRRRGLRWLGGAAMGAVSPLGLIGCGGGETDDSTSSADDGSCRVIPTETAGPYPADGSSASNQRLNALTLSGIVRSDIRSSVGGASGTALGVPLTVVLTLVDAGNACAALAGRAVYLWHCTRDGSYSMYSGGHTGENYLRGIQVSDSRGQVSFSTVFPGCYSGRWPHIHFEVYDSMAAATDASSTGDYSKVSQLALPSVACDSVYAEAAGYGASVANFNSISLASDNVFGNDSAARQMASLTGSVNAGYIAQLTVGLGG